MYQVYIIYSKTTKVYYKGQTNDLIRRIARHNAGLEHYTSNGAPWQLVWFCTKDSRSEALALEKKLKNLSQARIELFIRKYPSEKLDGHGP